MTLHALVVQGAVHGGQSRQRVACMGRARWRAGGAGASWAEDPAGSTEQSPHQVTSATAGECVPRTRGQAPSRPSLSVRRGPTTATAEASRTRDTLHSPPVDKPRAWVRIHNEQQRLRQCSSVCRVFWGKTL